MLNSLSRTVLKLTLPGVPDIYQGTEFWDFSLVDPDNRRPVDYDARSGALKPEASLDELMRTWPDGRIKQQIHRALLHDRARSPALYAEGDYQPLTLEGAGASHVVGYARRHRTDALAVIAPRFWSALLAEADEPIFDPSCWQDISVSLPHGEWRNALTGEKILIDGDKNRMSDFMGKFPLAVLRLVDGEGGRA
jgi:(1->4)-alpha-D-glucan 1-alpha-D-glucosylmutase